MLKSVKEIRKSQVNSMISGQYEIFHVKDMVSPGKTIYHYHDFYEVHCTLKGVATFFLDGHQFDVEAGTVLLIHYHDLHRIIKQSTDDFERMYIFLTPDFLQQRSSKRTNLSACFQHFGQRRSKVIKVDVAKLANYLTPLDHSPLPEEYGADVRYEQQLLDFLIYLNQLVLKEENESQPKQMIENERIEAMITYISQNLDQPLTLEQMEKNFFVTKYYVTREFKKHTGFTFHQFVLKKKLLYAKQLLKEYRSASDVYLKCGFKSYPHFLKSFKKEFNMTPKEFLVQHKNNQIIHFDHYEESIKKVRLE